MDPWMNLDVVCNAYCRAGLQVNTKKTEILQRSKNSSLPVILSIQENQLKNTEKFIYLGSIISSNGVIDHEIQNCIYLASSDFGRLKDRVFLNRDLNLSTKIVVYRAVVVSTLSYSNSYNKLSSYKKN
uniref:Reverse transcriptase domain-containing protein n=1 Tax=Octopus bimaculoides TaxID=37653 RepID=A0A0L8IE58_OCTBM